MFNYSSLLLPHPDDSKQSYYTGNSNVIVKYPVWGKDKILNKKSVLFPSRMQFEQFVSSRLSSFFFVPCVFLFVKFCLLLLFFMHCGHFLHGLYINIRLQNTDLQQVTPKTLDNLP